MMTEIFERKKSPFYHFGELMRLGKLPREEFHQYLSERLKSCFADSQNELANDPLNSAIDHIVTSHGLDYERMWMNFKRTNKWIMQRLATGGTLQTGEYRTSTIYSALKRLQKEGYVIYSDRYEIEDPFFKEWILRGMS